jgi:kynurenine formamidase
MNGTNVLWSLLSELKSRSKYVDLTHGFGPGIPHAPGFADEKRVVLSDHPTDGFMVHRYDHVGQWGTHVDPPIHFVADGRTLDQIRIDEMLLPLVVLDVSAQVERDPDYVISLGDVEEWEDRNGPVPAGAFAALRTDWSSRWPDPQKMKNADSAGIRHSPGWSRDVLAFLCDERDIAACGHETMDTDPGVVVSDVEFPCEAFILKRDRYQIELMTNLDQLPEAGCIAVASFAKPIGGSGFPARVFALAPK